VSSIVRSKESDAEGMPRILANFVFRADGLGPYGPIGMGEDEGLHQIERTL
jgi:hypothetical protein